MNVDTLTWITYIVAGAIYMAILYTYFASTFDMRYSARVTIGVYIVIYCSDIFSMYIDNEITNIITSIIVFGVLIYLYLGNLKTRISMAVFIYLAAFLSEYLAAYSIVFINGTAITDIVFGTPEFLYGLLVAKVLLAVFAKILSNITKRRKLPKLTTLHWLALIVTPVGSIFVLHNFLYLTPQAPNISDMISSIIVVIINFIVITVYDKILADYEASVKNKLLEEQVKYYSYQNFLAESSEKLVCKTKHDIKHLLIAFKADIQNNKQDDVEIRINELLGEINSLDGPAKSGNIAVDAIINFKVDFARKRQIYFSLELKIPQNLELDSSAVCSILGNALDNAIEATEKVSNTSKRIIQLDMSYKHETIFLKIVNPFIGEIATDKRGHFLSAKRGFREEGIGLQSIKNTVTNNGGDIDVEFKNNEFCVSIMLYGIKTSEKTPALQL